MSTRLPIYLRAHTVKSHICSRCKKAVEVLRRHKKAWVCISCIDELGGNEKTRPPKRTKEKPDRWPERCLIFDTEVRTVMDEEHGYQALTFGVFRICVSVGGDFLCEREGILYSG